MTLPFWSSLWKAGQGRTNRERFVFEIDFFANPLYTIHDLKDDYSNAREGPDGLYGSKGYRKDCLALSPSSVERWWSYVKR